MKKLSYLFITILSFIGINYVSADTYNFDFSLDDFTDINFSEQQLINLLDQKLELVLDYWEDNYKTEYPYYYVGIDTVVIGSKRVDMLFHMFKGIPNTGYVGDTLSLISQNSAYIRYSIYCNYNDNETSYCYDNPTFSDSGNAYYYPLFYARQPGNQVIYRHYLPFSYYTSNFDYIFNQNNTYNIVKNNEIIHTVNNGDIIPTYKDLFITPMVYQEINLNDYSYVALSLKDYTLRNDNINQFYTNIYTKGQLCLTPVYNYGMTEKTDYYNGYQVDRCSVEYADFTPVRTYILKQDLQNNAIYYLKAYNTDIENKVKVDTNVFNISYITQENADNPSVNVNGKSYPTIAYDDLSSTSTMSEQEGYVSGQVVNVFDQLDENFVDNFFSNPLNMLKSVWGAITSMLNLIFTFVALLPPTLQGFLYMSFALVIILGCLKMLL